MSIHHNLEQIAHWPEIESKQCHIHIEEPTTSESGGITIIIAPPDSPVLKLRVKTTDSQKLANNLSELERRLQGSGLEVKAEQSAGKTVALLLIVKLQDQPRPQILAKINGTLKRVHEWQLQHPKLPVVLRLTGEKWLDDHIRQEIERQNYSIELENPLLYQSVQEK